MGSCSVMNAGTPACLPNLSRVVAKAWIQLRQSLADRYVSCKPPMVFTIGFQVSSKSEALAANFFACEKITVPSVSKRGVDLHLIPRREPGYRPVGRRYMGPSANWRKGLYRPCLSRVGVKITIRHCLESPIFLRQVLVLHLLLQDGLFLILLNPCAFCIFQALLEFYLGHPASVRSAYWY